MNELVWKSATEITGLIREKKLSPVEYLDAILARTAEQEERINMFTHVATDQARATARQAEKSVTDGDTLGPLHGLPVHVKDLFPTKGIPTEYGSNVHKGNIPTHDDILVRRLIDAGANIFAKSTTPEFGHKGQTDGPAFGATRNPWDRSRNSGGSSGGAAAAVAAGTGPLGLGTDGAGSIRIPAAACGTVGLKPTPGLLPYGEAVDAFYSYAAAGPLCRTIDDARLMMAALSGPDAVDPWSLGAPKFGTAGKQLSGDRLDGLRIAYVPYMTNAYVSNDVLQNTRTVLTALENRGAEIEEVDTGIDWIEKEGRLVYQSTFAVGFGKHLAEWRDKMDPVLVGFIERGSANSMSDFRQAQLARTRLYRAVQALYEKYDVLITPTLTRTALPWDFDALDGRVMVDGKDNGITRQGMSPYCYPFNLSGNPALAVPSGFASDGLPTSVQLIGPWHHDADLLHIGSMIEADLPWAHLRPSDVD